MSWSKEKLRDQDRDRGQNLDSDEQSSLHCCECNFGFDESAIYIILGGFTYRKRFVTLHCPQCKVLLQIGVKKVKWTVEEMKK